MPAGEIRPHCDVLVRSCTQCYVTITRKQDYRQCLLPPAPTVRSDHALARLALLTRDGRSQVQVIEDALDRMPLPKRETEKVGRRARIEAILATVPKRA